MQNRKLMAILSLIFIVLGTILATLVTMDYRGNADKLRNRIDSLTTENNLINKRNEDLNKAIDTTTSRNQELITQNVEITNKNQEFANSNLVLTKRIEDLSKLTFEKAKELQYPISDNFSISYRISFKKDEFLKLIPPKGKRWSPIFSLSTPKEYEISVDELPENYPHRYSYVLTQHFKEIFAKGYIYVSLKKGDTIFHLEKSYNEGDIFDKHNFNNANKNLPYRNPGAHVFHREDEDMFHFEFKDLPIRISLNTGNYASMFDFNDSEVVVKVNPYSGIQNVLFESLWINMENQPLFGIANFTYNSDKDEYKSSDKIKLLIK